MARTRARKKSADAVPVATQAASGPPDLSDFERASWALEGLNGVQVVQVAAFGMGLRSDTVPELIPPAVLDVMRWTPEIYHPERALVAPALDVELYYQRFDGPDADKVKAEVDAHMRPIMPAILQAAARAFAWGAIPIVLDWVVDKALAFVATSDTTGDPRWRSIVAHPHYKRVHELWPGNSSLRVGGDLHGWTVYNGHFYAGEHCEEYVEAQFGQIRGDEPRVATPPRSFVAVVDQDFGRWIGQGSRRRAFEPWFEHGMVRLWERRWVERSVDLPRVGYAPEGEVTVAGQKILATKLLRAQVMALRNGSALILPSTTDAGPGGQRKWDLKVLESPDRGEAFERELDARGRRMALASLMPGALDKASEELFNDHVQGVCDFAAKFLSRVTAAVHRLRYPNQTPPEWLANDVPKRKQRLLKEVFAACVDSVAHKGKKVYTLGELVHPEILEQLGVRSRTVDEAAHAPDVAPGAPPGKAGRKKDATGDREVRRDQSPSLDGEEDTGAPREDPAQ